MGWGEKPQCPTQQKSYKNGLGLNSSVQLNKNPVKMGWGKPQCPTQQKSYKNGLGVNSGVQLSKNPIKMGWG